MYIYVYIDVYSYIAKMVSRYESFFRLYSGADNLCQKAGFCQNPLLPRDSKHGHKPGKS